MKEPKYSIWLPPRWSTQFPGRALQQLGALQKKLTAIRPFELKTNFFLNPPHIPIDFYKLKM
jgi:hypothetical protein